MESLVPTKTIAIIIIKNNNKANTDRVYWVPDTFLSSITVHFQNRSMYMYYYHCHLHLTDKETDPAMGLCVEDARSTASQTPGVAQL